ncbi:exopolygalacturonase-like [Typha latifolia]|uniref:exopolygalacturonase-like n=1 Tax=Typha latifolia TaxID=4733 RepID=UPI003C2BFA0F
MELKLLILLYIIFHGISIVDGRTATAPGIFNVMHFGAQANGLTDDSQAFLKAWKAACRSTGVVRVVIPRGTYFLSPVQFSGPCPNVQLLTVQLQASLKASTDLTKYVKGTWVQFGWVDNLRLTGGGTLDGQGSASWRFNKCPVKLNCKVLPTSLTFVNTNNTAVKGITSLNSKFFHIALLGNQNLKASKIKISAPANSPNTDGIHLEHNSGVKISNSVIGTGDDCVSIGQGNNDVTLSGINCGPGHGISVGSLGKYKNEGDVTGLMVRDCTLIGTDNGLRIKTWANSPSSTKASNITYENILMRNVKNPIIIDQAYCPYAYCKATMPSRVKISNIKFKNIRGTSMTTVAVALMCSQGFPCQKVSLRDVNLQYIGAQKTVATCQNVVAEYAGVQKPPPCQSQVSTSKTGKGSSLYQ